MNHRLGLVAAIHLLALASACGTAPSAPPQPCPCATGWTCCAGGNVCVAEGEACPRLLITPAEAGVRLGGSARFTASEGVTWSIAEGDAGGHVDADGTYHAPVALGTWHVVATAPDGSAATATVTVGPHVLTRVTGQPGGAGRLDGIGTDARLGAPLGVVGNGNGTLYLVDAGPAVAWVFDGHIAIRAVDLATRSLTTLSTQLPEVKTAPARMPVVLDGGHLYYASMTSIHRFDLATGEASLVAGDDKLGGQVDGKSADARFAEIAGMIADGAGNLYVVEGGANLGPRHDHKPGYGYLPDAKLGDDSPILRKIELATGVVTTIAGTPGTGADAAAHHGFHDGSGAEVLFGSLEAIGLAPPSYGKGFYLVDGANGAVRHYDPDTNQVKTKCTFQAPAPDIQAAYHTAAGPMLVEGGELRAFNIVGSSTCYRLAANYGPVGPLATVWTTTPAVPGGSAADIYVARRDSTTIAKVGVTGPFIGLEEHGGVQDGTRDAALLSSPRELVPDGAGGLYFLDSSNATTLLRHVDAAGTVTTVQSLAPHSGGRLALGASGTYAYVSFQSDELIERINLDDPKDTVALFTRGKDTSTYRYPDALAVDEAAGALYFIDQGNYAIERLALADLTVTTVRSQVVAAYDLALDGKGHLLVGAWSRLYELTLADASLRTVASGFDFLDGLAYDPAGVAYMIDQGRVLGVMVSTGDHFELVGVSGSPGVAVGPLPAGLNGPRSVAVLPTGDVAIGDGREHVILAAKIAVDVAP
jgi:hypothetical protein